MLQFCFIKPVLVIYLVMVVNTIADIGDPVYALLYSCFPNFYYDLVFHPFDFERTWWSVIQKRVVHTKFDIYGFITITGLILVNY